MVPVIDKYLAKAGAAVSGLWVEKHDRRGAQSGTSDHVQDMLQTMRFSSRQLSATINLMPLIGHVCKMAYGWAVGAHADTTLALEAWQAAQATFHELRISPADMIVHHDQDPVYTGYGWSAQLLLKDQARLSYALNGAKDNPQMESFIGRFKTENHSLLLEAADLPELCSVVTEQMLYYNTQRRHSSLGYMSPLAYIKQVRCDASA